MNNQPIGPVLGKIPSGLFILSAQSPDGDETGMLASWIQQAAFEPPMITVAVNKTRYLNDWLKVGKPIAVSLLGETQKQFLGHFGRGFEQGEAAFEGLTIDRSPAGLPVLSQALGWLEGTIEGNLDAGDHTLYTVRLTAAAQGPGFNTERPYVHVRRSGAGY